MGTAKGAAKARKIALAKNPNHFREIGIIGGRATKPENRPFYKDRLLASRAGKIGGSTKRNKSN